MYPKPEFSRPGSKTRSSMKPEYTVREFAGQEVAEKQHKNAKLTNRTRRKPGSGAGDLDTGHHDDRPMDVY